MADPFERSKLPLPEKEVSVMQRALTLIEVVVVLLIIALLAGLLVPVFLKARRYAQTTPCTSNLRQIHAAWAMYREDNDGRWPWFAVELFPYAKSREVFKCPLDAYNGIHTQESVLGGFPVSYYLVPGVRRLLDILYSVDKNHGVVACILHGDIRHSRYLERGRGLFEPLAAFDGLTLRVRLDGSVQRAQVYDERCYYDENGILNHSYCAWHLYTDVREEQARARWCLEPVDPNAYVPCP
jgi:prepilin-type N-terminal cleavage/methylation domain-containing protein